MNCVSMHAFPPASENKNEKHGVKHIETKINKGAHKNKTNNICSIWMVQIEKRIHKDQVCCMFHIKCHAYCAILYRLIVLKSGCEWRTQQQTHRKRKKTKTRALHSEQTPFNVQSVCVCIHFVWFGLKWPRKLNV